MIFSEHEASLLKVESILRKNNAPCEWLKDGSLSSLLRSSWSAMQYPLSVTEEQGGYVYVRTTFPEREPAIDRPGDLCELLNASWKSAPQVGFDTSRNSFYAGIYAKPDLRKPHKFGKKIDTLLLGCDLLVELLVIHMDGTTVWTADMVELTIASFYTVN